MKVQLIKSPIIQKKWRVLFENGTHTDFGATGYSDFTMHKDPARMRLYVQRHRSRETWGLKGIKTAGFWSRWLLWSEPSLSKAKKLIQKKFKITIQY